MKKLMPILLGCFLCVTTSHVSYAADVGKHLSTKTEYSVPVMHYDFVAIEIHAMELNAITIYSFTSFKVEPVSTVAILVNDVGKEYDHGMYLPVTKSNYRSPFVDKDYKWKYSAWYNS